MNAIAVGSVFAGLGVVLGAFGAHGLRDRLSPEMLEIYQTGVQYQFYHALGLILLGLFIAQRGQEVPAAAGYAGWAFLVGILIFSGSLYLLVLTDTRWLGAITPIGGVAFILGWVFFAWAAFQN